MEKRGPVTFREEYLAGERALARVDAPRMALIMAHELAHPWSATWSPCAGGTTCGGTRARDVDAIETCDDAFPDFGARADV